MERWLATREETYLLALMKGVDLRENGSEQAQRALDDAFFLFETLALLRSTKTHHPAKWSVFRTLLASRWLIAANRTPWARYTEAYCDVYACPRRQ